MDTFRPDNSKNPLSGDREGTGGKLGAFSRSFHRLWTGLYKDPAPADTAPMAAVTDIADIRADRPPQPAAEGGTALAGTTEPTRAAGEVFDMERYRREREARAEVDAAIAALPHPEPSSAEDLFQR